MVSDRLHESSRLIAVRDWVLDRAEITPGLIAFRFAGQAISYARLAEALEAQVAAVEGHGFGPDAGIVAALVECAPAVLASGDADQIAAVMDGVITWLSRYLDDGSDEPTLLRAIG